MSITDGTFVCGLCGEWLTGCVLCDNSAPLVDRRQEIERERREAWDADNELWRQERAIRDAAEARRRGDAP